MSWTAQKIHTKSKPGGGGWGGVKVLGGQKSKVLEVSWTAQKIDKKNVKPRWGWF